MKITRNDIRKIILEMNPDGTISPDEDEEEEALYEVTVSQLEALCTHVNEKAIEIGGAARSGGIKFRIYAKLLETMLQHAPQQFSRRIRR